MHQHCFADRRAPFEQGLCALLVRCGAPSDPALAAAVAAAVDGMLEALGESGGEQGDLSALDVVRIRANKLAATRIPAAVFRDGRRRAALRAEIQALALAWLGPEARRGSRFGP